METGKDIMEILTNDHHDYNIQLQAVANLKKLFKPPDKIFSKLKLEPVLQSARILLENKTPEKDFLYSCGISLVDFIGRDATLDSEILHLFENLLTGLKKLDETLTDELVAKFWNKLEKGFGSHPDGVLDASKQTIERTVLEWIDSTDNPRMEFVSRMCADSPNLFQTITSILYEVLVRTRGHGKVFEVTESFVESVRRECKKKGKSFLGLYPRGCRRLVSLLRLPPELCSEGRGDIAKEVLSLLLEMFLVDREGTLILLSHYTKWVRVFKIHLEENQS